MPATSDRSPNTASRFFPGAEKNTSPCRSRASHEVDRLSLPSSMQIVRFFVPRMPDVRSGREKSVLLKASFGKIAFVSEPLQLAAPQLDNLHVGIGDRLTQAIDAVDQRGPN